MVKCKHQRQKLLVFHHSLRMKNYLDKKEYLTEFYFCKFCKNYICKKYLLKEVNIVMDEKEYNDKIGKYYGGKQDAN